MLLPAPGGPVMPTTRARPVCGVERGATSSRCAVAAVLDERDRPGHGARLALEQARHELVESAAQSRRGRAARHRPLSSWRAITRRWISLVPSPMVQILASR